MGRFPSNMLLESSMEHDMDNTRRALISVPVLGLSACATPAFKSIQKAIGPRIDKGKAVPRTSEEIAQAAQAEAIFKHFLAKKEVLVAPTVSAFDLRAAKANWIREVNLAKQSPTLTLAQSAALGAAVVPLLKAIDEIGTTRKQVLQPAAGTVSLRNGVISLPAGGFCSFESKGTCLDQTMPAPNKGEPFRMVPIERVISSALIPVYRSMLLKSGADPLVKQNLQGLSWLLRAPGNQNAATQINSVTRQLLDHVHPGGSLLFERAVATEGLLAPLRDILGVADGIASFDFSTLSNPAAAAAAVDAHLQQLSRMKVAQPIPQDNSYLSMAGPQLAVMSVGEALLRPRISILNASTSPASFDLSRFAAVSPRDVQRVSLIPPESVSGRGFPMVSDASAFTAKSEVDEILDALKVDGKSLLPKMVGFIPSMQGRIGKLVAKGARHAPLRAAIEALPFVGNVLSAYSIYTGRDWASGEELTPADYVLNAMGTIPGAAQLTRLAGVAGVPKVIKWALNSAGANFIGKSGDFVGPISEYAGYTLFETAELLGPGQYAEAAKGKIDQAINYAIQRA